MDYEKLHKDTINRLQQMVSCGKITVEVARGICADFEPESEDEEIREKVIATIHLYYGEPLEDEAKEMIAWLEKQGEQKSVEWSEDDEAAVNDIIAKLARMKSSSVDGGSEKEICAMEIDWLKSLKNRVQMQSKQEWSEKDKNHINTIKRALYDAVNITPIEREFAEKWLKSLRPQKQWKPSESDIRILEQVIDGTANPINYHATLHAIFEKLKKLREE